MKNSNPQAFVFDGSSTKSLDSIPGVNTSALRGSVQTVGEAYGVVSYAFRCIHLRSNSLSKIPFRVRKRGSRESASLADLGLDDDRLTRLLWLTESALCLHGAAYWFRERNLIKTLGFRWLAPQTITPTYDPAFGLTGFLRNLQAQPGFGPTNTLVINLEERTDPGVQPYGQVPDFTLEDVVYYFLPDPEVEVGPGRSPTHVVLEAVGLLKYLNEYASAFFQRGAIPAVLLTVDGNPPDSELAKLESWWKKIAMGVSRAWQTKAVRASVKPQIIGQPVKDLAMPSLNETARRQIAVSYGVPVTLLEDAANYGTARTHRKSFYTETVIPEAILVQGGLNEQVFYPLGLQFEFLPEHLEIMQEEEVERAGALHTLRQSGVPLLSALRILGYDVDEDVLDDIEAGLESDIGLTTDESRLRDLERQKLQLARARQRLAERREQRLVDREKFTLQQLQKEVA